MAVRAAALTVSVALFGLWLAGPALGGADPVEPGIHVTNTAPPGSGGFQDFLNWAGWGGAVAGVLGLIITGVKFALAHKRGDDGGEQMASFGKVCTGLIVLSMAGPVVNALS